MALGASEAVKTTRLAPIKIIGVDALPGAGSGMSFVSDKLLTASLLYPTGGAEAIRNVIKILRHEPLQKETRLQTLVIDSTNVRMMNMQYDKILAQQHDIEQQQDMLKEQQRIYNTQRTLLYVLVCTLVLSVFFAGLLFYSRQLNKKINTQLAHQNEEITRKSEQLVKMSAKAAEAHEARLNFFTNISHEFRTPLTLIISPLQEMLKNPRLLPIVRQQYSMINKNANRLLRLVNQLIDFRKVEFNKMKIKASANELVSFTKEVVQAFQEIAVKRNIDCRLITREQQLPIWIDANIMDQVLFNLLSNAFKFTPDGGSIIVRVDKNVEENKAILEIQDTGAGMTEKEQEHAFEIFYQGDHENHKGSGIGLALSRQLVSLHHGTITLNCQKGKGCTFTIHLPLGNAHLDEIELMGETNNMNHPDRVEQEWLNDLLPVESPASLEGLQHVSSNLPTILLIEDHPELREFIKLQLSSKYQIIEADNGISALQFAFDYLPDLIICDVMIPGKDGIAVTSELKNDLRTAHIPIIILTAKASVEQQVEGIKSMADAYISKPFHLHVLDQTMNNLLTNRIKLKEHYTAEFPAGSPIAGQKQQDRKFISEFKAIVENNIANDQFAIDDICKAMRISKVQLYRKTKNLMNTNINEYILNTRIQKSKYYLQHEDLTIAEVAYKTGFASAAYFSTVFKSKTGTSPTLFKEKKNPSA
jgi:signal transduction histidine kinase/DNA-binding response OmpR family regulator